MIEINRWNPDHTPNPEFFAIFNGKKIYRSPLLESSGRYECCYIYNGKVYENWVNWGYDCLYLLDKNDHDNEHQDREGRIGETYKVDRCQEGSELIDTTEPMVQT